MRFVWYDTEVEIPELDLKKSYAGVRVLLRSSLNVPVQKGVVTNAFRMKESLQTIETLASRGARVVVCAHLGQEPTNSLRPVYEALKTITNAPLFFVDEVTGTRAREAVSKLKDGEVLILENVRREAGEASNDPALAEALARLGDLYVNDAFSDSHRAHASIVGVPALLPHFAGPNFIKELNGISPARAPQSPSLAIIGGAKFLTKEPLVERLLETYDRVFIGGALANDFFKAQGYEMGKSLVSGTSHVSKYLENKKLILPASVVVQNPNGREEKLPNELTPLDSVLDIGQQSVVALAPYIKEAKSILWNGPLGNFENGFKEGTEAVVRQVAESSAHSVIGGGDTVAAIEYLKLNGRFSHVSSAGGAMLDFITHGTLAGIEALK